jgi:beta-glucanase (GH16 family)
MCWCKAGGDQVYGTWQVRAKFDAGAGYGPIVMLWPQSGNPNTDGFVSFVRAPKPDRTALGTMLSWPGGKAIKTLNGNFTAWHTYTVDWRPNVVKISVDGRLLFDSSTTAGAVVPKKPMHLVLQVLVGPVDDVPAANAGTPDRVVMHVDWVRYYR